MPFTIQFLLLRTPLTQSPRYYTILPLPTYLIHVRYFIDEAINIIINGPAICGLFRSVRKIFTGSDLLLLFEPTLLQYTLSIYSVVVIVRKDDTIQRVRHG